MCFVAMPFGKKGAPGENQPQIDFDQIFPYIKKGTDAAGLDTIRADFEPSGGFIHKPMLERLLVAEYVIADLTLSNPNVMYEVGVRHGASARATLLIGADKYLPSLAFDVKPLRVLPYTLAADNSLSASAGDTLASELCERLTLARAGKLPVDNPIMQVTSWKPGGAIEHSKTDVFLQRLQYTGEVGERIKLAVATSDRAQAVQQLAVIEEEIIPLEIPQLHTALIGVFLGYREKRAYQRMVDLYERFPAELKQTPVAREQLALALNRLAEQAAQNQPPGATEALRNRAIQTLNAMAPESVTSETYGIRGRIYKGWHDALVASQAAHDQNRARAQLQSAIENYEQGFCSDIRDYYPGVNAITLRLLRGSADDSARLAELLPVVRFAVATAPAPRNNEERYWQTATKLELATAARDWQDAKQWENALTALDAEPWMFKTTMDNLVRQKQAFAADPDAVLQLEQRISALSPLAH
jgi:hypothetical protein